ncbi:zinc finger protein 568 [Alligator mississippiensis]|uniref:zinc finger protein 568 n=1 Tax=Alligator mississippiensis TaxID=8496 RepID=UPI002877400C|nr:zinc finger protein 568 [Alligator mississippiensis]
MAAAKMKEQAPAGPQPVAGGKWPDTGPRVLRARTGRGSPRAVQPTPREEPVLRWEVLRAPLAPAPAAPVLVTPHRLELVPGDALQVTVHAEQQQVAVMAPQGVSRGPPDSCLEQPVHVPRRQAGSPAPPHTREEESPPEQESDSSDTDRTWDSSADESSLGLCRRRGPSPGAAGAGPRDKAEEQPPQEGPADLELPKPGARVSSRPGQRKKQVPARRPTGEKCHGCPECGKRFTRANNLAIHRRLHSGEQLHKCPECGKTCVTHSDLAKHLRVHSQERPHKCPECSKTFIKLSHLARHRRGHSEAWLYSCDECGDSFVFYSSLVRHRHLHARQQP